MNGKLVMLTDKNISEIQKLCENTNDYFIMENGKGTSKEEYKEILESLPPGSSMEDKYVFGYYNEDGKLVGLIDIIAGYPNEGIWMLGLLIIDSMERNKGYGEALYREVEKFVKDKGGKTIRIAVFEENKNAFVFWNKQGFKFKEVKERDKYDGGKRNISIMLKSVC
ncbi:MAG: GNAT family N-acetyltransferase [Firmicutes bacterium]|jgi:ribosomal protein S18 acetylase RimI-like enzyme|nr:GNAT family N-acetyltransferase [Bacillota bacterium]